MRKTFWASFIVTLVVGIIGLSMISCEGKIEPRVYEERIPLSPDANQPIVHGDFDPNHLIQVLTGSAYKD